MGYVCFIGNYLSTLRIFGLKISYICFVNVEICKKIKNFAIIFKKSIEIFMAV